MRFGPKYKIILVWKYSIYKIFLDVNVFKLLLDQMENNYNATVRLRVILVMEDCKTSLFCWTFSIDSVLKLQPFSSNNSLNLSNCKSRLRFF